MQIEPPKRSKVGLVIFWGGAAFLAPWTLALFLTQQTTGTAHHVRGVSVGITICLLIGMVLTARLASRRSNRVLLSAAFSGTLAFITAWFGSASTQDHLFWVLLGYALAVLLPVAVLSYWVVRVAYDRRGTRPRYPPWVPVLYALGAASLAVPIVVGAAAVHSTHTAVHLRVLWTGLDCFELAFLVASGVCVWRRSSAVAMTAMCLGTLLFADAWYNIVATTGSAQVAAVVMAFGELPLSGYSVYAAHHEVARWPETDPAR